MSYGDGGFWFTQPTGYGFTPSDYGMVDPVVDLTALDPAAFEAGLRAGDFTFEEYQAQHQAKQAELTSGMADWQKAAAVVALVLWAIRKR